jgi:hypothetical protein
MTLQTSLRSILWLAIATLSLSLVPAHTASAQKRPPSLREFLLQYKGKEIQISDKTGGTEQFTSGDPSKAYTLILNDVETDYIVVSRATATDKRTFVYPMSVIRRVIYMFDGKPFDKILLEMY